MSINRIRNIVHLSVYLVDSFGQIKSSNVLGFFQMGVIVNVNPRADDCLDCFVFLVIHVNFNTSTNSVSDVSGSSLPFKMSPTFCTENNGLL